MRVLLIAILQEIPPDHRGGYDLAVDEISEPFDEWDATRARLDARVPDGWRMIALRTSTDRPTAVAG